MSELSILSTNAFQAINTLEQVPQAQYSLEEQLQVLRVAANKLGLYDAADFLERYIER